MFKRSMWICRVAPLAMLCVLWGSDWASAQYSYRRANQYPFVSAIDAMNVYGAYTQGPGFFYTGGIAPANAPEEQVAYIHVRVSPPHAEISFEGSKTSQIGSSRLYTSPPLNPGENYSYDVRVTWKENGREVVQERKVPVRAGDRLSIVFRAPAGPDKTSMMKTKPGT